MRALQAWYMKKKRYNREGHQMKAPFLKELYEHSARGLTQGYEIIAIHETTLVQSKIKGALDSSDRELNKP